MWWRLIGSPYEDLLSLVKKHVPVSTWVTTAFLAHRAELREANVPSECLKIRMDNDFHEAATV